MGMGALVVACTFPVWAAERPARKAAPVRLTASSPSFLENYLAPELARNTEGFSTWVSSPAYDFQRESGTSGHFETVERIEHGAVRAARRAARDWLVEATGVERL